MSPALKLINSGLPAMEIVSRALRTAEPTVVPSSMGPVWLKPGTIWSANKMLVMVQGSTTYCTIDDRLYEWTTSDFVRAEWVDATQRAARGAEGWVAIAKVEMALLCGLFVPWYLMLGMSCAKVGVFFAAHKNDMEDALRRAPTVMNRLRTARRKNPTLYKVVKEKTTRDVWTELKEGHGITGEDVGFFIGRVIRGAVNAPELSLALFLKIVVQVTAIVGITHAPGIAYHLAEAAARKNAEHLGNFLRSTGYSVTTDEVAEIIREAQSDASSVENLKGLERDLRALLPALERLRRADRP